jgi:hypothetical protein
MRRVFKVLFLNVDCCVNNRRYKMIEAIESGHESGYEFRRHEDHDYIEGLFYTQIESLTRGCRR